MHVLIVELAARPGRGAALASVLEGMAEVAGREPGVIFYGVNRARDVADGFVLCEMYADEAAFDAHVQLPAIQRALGQFESLLATAPRITRCDAWRATPFRGGHLPT